jgi:hypothetical protein
MTFMGFDFKFAGQETSKKKYSKGNETVTCFTAPVCLLLSEPKAQI